MQHRASRARPTRTPPFVAAIHTARRATRALAFAALAALLAACGDDPAGPAAPAVRFADCVAVTAYSPTSGWRATCPPAAHVDSALLRAAYVQAPHALPSVLSLLIVRHGWIVGENYYNGARATSAFEMRSVTKSVTSALTGAAIQQGVLDSAGHKLSDLLPDYFPASTDPRKFDITLRHLLSMEAGWSPDAPLPNVNPYVAALIGRDLATAPGTAWNYDDGTYHILAAALDRATGRNLFGFATDHLFTPLGVTVDAWNWIVDEQGIPVGSGGLALTARDMAKLGELYLRDGVWDGQRILPAGWVDSSWVARASGTETVPTTYGYGWWGHTEGSHAYHYALGFGGQFIVVVPDLDLVVVLTANPYTPDSAPVDHFRALLRDQILPAILPE